MTTNFMYKSASNLLFQTCIIILALCYFFPVSQCQFNPFDTSDFIFDSGSGLFYEAWKSGRDTGNSSEPTRAQGMSPQSPQISRSFLGFNISDVSDETGFRFIPPDPMGAAGPSSLIAVCNVIIESRTKQGKLNWRTSLQNFFAPVDVQSFTFDPKVVYDHFRGRFVVVTIERLDLDAGDPRNSSNYISQFYLAVSKSDTPLTASSDDWYFMAIDAKDQLLSYDIWADYPGFEVDQSAIYITANMFTFCCGFLFGGTRLWIVAKDDFYDGGVSSVTMHDPWLAAGSGLRTTLQPAQRFVQDSDSAASVMYLVGYSGLNDGVNEFVGVIAVLEPLSANPQFSLTLVDIGDIDCVAAALPDAPQAGGTALVEVNDRRALDAVWRDDSLWITFTIDPRVIDDGADCVSTGVTKAYWVKLNVLDLNITLDSAGIIDGADIDDSADVSTFFPSVAVNGDDVAMFGFAASSANIYPGAFVTGVEPGKTQTVKAGEDYYLLTFGFTRNRWGDYNGIALDPVRKGKNKCGKEYFWVFNEYSLPQRESGEDGFRGNWGTAWARISVSSEKEKSKSKWQREVYV